MQVLYTCINWDDNLENVFSLSFKMMMATRGIITMPALGFSGIVLHSVC